MWPFNRKPRRAAQTDALPQLAYDVACFILPHVVFHDRAKLDELLGDRRNIAGPLLYTMAAKGRSIEPRREDAERFRWHVGPLDEGREYAVLEFPEPPPVDLAAMPVLAPHFLAIVRSGPATPDYFILGQAPFAGGTTLRCLLPDGKNCNLGPGPTPTLAAFLDAIRARRS